MAGNLILNLAQQDELDDIKRMLWTIQELMTPSSNLSLVNRDNLTCALSYFSERYQKCTDDNEQDSFKNCLNALIDLVSAENDLSGVDRKGFSAILFILCSRLDKVLKGDV